MQSRPSPPAIARPRSGPGSPWSERYARRHQYCRISQFPEGILPPQKVRIYRRRDHFLLQWWDPAEKCTLNTRVDGDLATAIVQARGIGARLAHCNTAGTSPRRIAHGELVEAFVADLSRRANAGEIDVATVSRYESALRHYRNFAEQASLSAAQRYTAGIDRKFQLQFAAYLNGPDVLSSGYSGGASSPMKGQAFVLDVVRSMLEWAADPDRGNLLPGGFHNPFRQRARSSQRVAADPLRPLDITTSMAVDLVLATDRFQLAIFAPLLLYGLRPGELGWLFAEHVQANWLVVPNISELDYTTKGRRDKRFPVTTSLRALWQLEKRSTKGLIYGHRAAAEGPRRPSLAGLSLTALAEELRQRYAALSCKDAIQRRQVRNRLMKDAGQPDYDHVEAEFQQLASRLQWPAAATLKDFRHLFCTCLQNSGMPELYRRYLMGHAFGKAPIVGYSHLTQDKIDEHFQRALATELGPVAAAIDRRAAELGVLPSSA
jgi:hypothetical protein